MAPCGPGVRTTRARSESHAVTSPPKVSELSRVTQVSAGNNFSLAVGPNGTAHGGPTTTADSRVRATNSRAGLLARAVAATCTRGRGNRSLRSPSVGYPPYQGLRELRGCLPAQARPRTP